MFNHETRVFDTEFRGWEIDLSQFTPVDDRVLLERVDLPESAVVLADREPIHRGRVLRVGPGKRTGDGSRLPMQLKGGEMVRYMSADVDNRTHVLIQEADVLFIES